MFRTYRIILFDRFGIISLLFVVLHQSVVASSSFFLTKLIEHFQSGDSYIVFLYFYLSAMVFPYVPGSLSLVFLRKWISSAHQTIIFFKVSALYGKTDSYIDHQARKYLESIISRNSFVAVEGFLSFIQNFLGAFLNGFLSVAILSWLLPGHLVVGYLTSLFLGLIIIYHIRIRLIKLTRDAEISSAIYAEALSRVWDNAVLGNRYHYQLWIEKIRALGSKYYSKANAQQALRQAGNIILAAASLFPTIFIVLYIVLNHAATPLLIAAIIVNLTRIFQILNSLSALVDGMLEWASVKSKMKIVLEPTHLSPTRVIQHTPPEVITLNGKRIVEMPPVIQSILSMRHGRLTVRGRNGSGKTTLLLHIKFLAGDQAILIPAHHGHLVWKFDQCNLSTGRQTVHQLQEIRKDGRFRYLLLDEWDANLDTENKAIIHQLIQELSERHVVVEIRH